MNMNYAIVEAGGKQYIVKKGDVIEVEKINSKEKEIILDKVLLTVENGNVSVGSPYLSNAVITAKLLEPKKGEKISILRYRSKSRHRRRVGHRKDITPLEISNISLKSTREKKANS